MSADSELEYQKLTDLHTHEMGANASQMFGKPCLKVDGKAYLAHHKDALVFKLSGDDHQRAIHLKGATLWDPSGKGRPMKAWIALPIEAKKHFLALAQAAYTSIIQNQ